MIKPRYWSWMA